MKSKDLLTISSVAVGTAALTVAAFWAGPIGAGGDGDESNQVPQPRLVAHGVELTLVAKDGRVFHAGDEPVFELRAVSTTNQPTSVQVRTMMTALAVPDMLSRVPAVPRSFWQKEYTLTLNPGEIKTLNLATLTKLPANRMISVLLQEVDPAGEEWSKANSTEVQKNKFSNNHMGERSLSVPVRFEQAITPMSFSTLTNTPGRRLASVN